MGLDLSKITKLISELCSEISCKSSCCHDAVLFEFDNKDTPAHIVHSSASDDSIKYVYSSILNYNNEKSNS